MPPLAVKHRRTSLREGHFVAWRLGRQTLQDLDLCWSFVGYTFGRQTPQDLNLFESFECLCSPSNTTGLELAEGHFVAWRIGRQRQTPQDLDLFGSFECLCWPSNTAGLGSLLVICRLLLAVKHRRTSLHVGFLIRGRRTAFFTESSKLTTLRDPLHIKDNRVSRQIPQEDDLILCLPAAQWQLLRSELQTKNILFAVLEVV